MSFRGPTLGALCLSLSLFVSHTVFAADTKVEVHDVQASDSVKTADPYESFNRSMFTFNEKVDKYLFKPVAVGYNTIMPKPLNQGVHNFFMNLANLPTIANDILQFHFHQMASDLWRLTINTTLGIGGFFDIAGRMGLKSYSNDFGLTMHQWGWENSNYVVLPFWGPRTVRDTVSLPVDYFLFSGYPQIDPQSLRFSLYALSVIDLRAQSLRFDSLYNAAAVDKYVFVRNAYLQHRAYQIKRNENLGAVQEQATDPESPQS